ncbi:MAG: hypothetical protein H0V31_11890 [Acidobacteria bacterium]|nr:hypothetical protein [Acidobacteriota bacterium]
MTFHVRRALELRKQFYGERHELVAKDLYYSWVITPREPAEAAKVLAEAINMMRETNLKNLNFPYMLSEYANRLISADSAKVHEAYRQAIVPPTNEGNYQIAERYYKEALSVFREYYQEENYAIVLYECALAFAQIKQNKLAEFEEHYQICQQSENKLKDESSSEIIKKDLLEIEKVLAAANR